MLDYDELEKNFKEIINSEKGKKATQDFIEKMNREEAMKDSQTERFYLKFKNQLPELIEKIIEKYNSKKYKDYWYDIKHQELPEDLYWVLFDCAEKFGRECSVQEWRKYGNTFTGSLFFLDGYYLQVINGQGSKVLIEKEDIDFTKNLLDPKETITVTREEVEAFYNSVSGYQTGWESKSHRLAKFIGENPVEGL